jgi:hypothetical protein
MKILYVQEALLAAGLLLLALPVFSQTGKPSPDIEPMLAHACYQGIEPGKDVCLKDGRSEGPPAVMMGPERATGDLDGDGVPETALLLTKDPKSPDQAVYLVIAAWRGDRIVNLATLRLGSQVNVRSFTISDGKVHLEGQRSASARTAMMPATLTFSLREGKLVQEE